MNNQTRAKWSGYLVTGVLDRVRLENTLVACFEGENLPQLIIEPGRVFVVSGFINKSIEVWNERRTRVYLDTECKQIEYQDVQAKYILVGRVENEPVRLAGGFQTIVTQSGGNNQLIIESTVGGGELGAPNNELPFDNEIAPVDRDYLDGGLDCNTVLRTINGVSGPHLVISGEVGVLVQPHPVLSRVVINVQGEAMNVCPDFSTPGPVECVPDRSDSCGRLDGQLDNCPPANPDSRADYLTTDDLSWRTTVSSGDSDTASLSVGPRIEGQCVFSWQNNRWIVVQDTTIDNTRCHEPGFSGYNGQRVVSFAKPLPPDPTTIIRNAYFTEGSKFWVLNNATVESEEENSPIPGFPYAEIELSGYISQSAVPVTPGRYTFQGDFFGVGGFTVDIKSKSGLLIHSQGFNISGTATKWTSIFNVGNVLTVDVRITVTSGSVRVTQAILVQQ